MTYIIQNRIVRILYNDRDFSDFHPLFQVNVLETNTLF